MILENALACQMMKENIYRTDASVTIMDVKIRSMLKKILPVLIKKPDLMFGHDTSNKEVEYVEEHSKLPVQILENLGGDHFFHLYAEKFSLSPDEGDILDKYLYSQIKGDKLSLKKLFDYLEFD